MDRAIDPVIAGRNVAELFGMMLREDIRPAQLRAAYRGVVAMLMEYRAKNIAPHLLRLTVEQRINEDNEWEAAGEEHPWQRLLRNPCPHLPPADVWNWMQKVYDGLGHADFVVKHAPLRLSSGRTGPLVPSALLPVWPEFGEMTPILDGEGGVTAWWYLRADGHQQTFQPVDVLRLSRIHPTDPRRTAGLVEAAAYSIDQLLAADIYGRDSMADQGKPEVMLETDKQLDLAKLQQLSDDFATLYRRGGPGGVPVSHGGLRIKELRLSKRDDQFQEQREFVLKVLLMVFETHGGLFSENATEANATTADRVFATRTVQPAVDDHASKLAHGLGVVFQVEEPGSLRVKAPNTVPVDEAQREAIDARRIERGVPPAQIMREHGEDVPANPALEASYLRATLVPAEGIPDATDDDEDGPTGGRAGF